MLLYAVISDGSPTFGELKIDLTTNTAVAAAAVKAAFSKQWNKINEGHLQWL